MQFEILPGTKILFTSSNQILIKISDSGSLIDPSGLNYEFRLALEEKQYRDILGALSMRYHLDVRLLPNTSNDDVLVYEFIDRTVILSGFQISFASPTGPCTVAILRPNTTTWQILSLAPFGIFFKGAQSASDMNTVMQMMASEIGLRYSPIQSSSGKTYPIYQVL